MVIKTRIIVINNFNNIELNSSIYTKKRFPIWMHATFVYPYSSLHGYEARYMHASSLSIPTSYASCFIDCNIAAASYSYFRKLISLAKKFLQMALDWALHIQYKKWCHPLLERHAPTVLNLPSGQLILDIVILSRTCQHHKDRNQIHLSKHSETRDW